MFMLAGMVIITRNKHNNKKRSLIKTYMKKHKIHKSTHTQTQNIHTSLHKLSEVDRQLSVQNNRAQ